MKKLYGIIFKHHSYEELQDAIRKTFSCMAQCKGVEQQEPVFLPCVPDSNDPGSWDGWYGARFYASEVPAELVAEINVGSTQQVASPSSQPSPD